MRTHWWVAAVLLLGVLRPASASACDLRLAYAPLGSQSSRISLGATVQIFPFEETGETGFTPSLSVGLRLAERIVVAPGLGFCSYGNDQNLIVGTGVALDVFRSEASWFGIQAHAGRVDFGEVTAIVLPVLATASFDLGEGAAFHIGAGIRHVRQEFGETSGESNMVAFGSVTVPVAGVALSVGAVILQGEDPNDATPVGGGPSYLDRGVKTGESASLGATIHVPIG